MSSDISKSVSTPPYVLLDDQLAGTLRYYKDPVEIITIYNAEDLAAALEKLQGYHNQGYHLAGYAAYELGYVLEPKLKTKLPVNYNAPLLQFGVFETYSSDVPKYFTKPPKPPKLNLKPDWQEADYLARYEQVKDYIAAGDIYQINLCFPMQGHYNGSAIDLYASLRARQPVHYGGIVSLNNGPEVISLSPELFFKRKTDCMTMQPMKGTIKRLPNPKADAALRDSLKADSKSQAENLMIVDLLRNDLSRISHAGSVKVPELYALETYPTLHQMTSKVTSHLKPNTQFIDIFKALFPCGSVTGAPKIRAMEIIRELEPAPRGAYCGAVGYIDPPKNNNGGDTCFNVGIRTLILEQGKLRYNVGSGVVLDSDGPDEYRECLLKADVVRETNKPYLIETMRLKADGKIDNIENHMARLKRSARALKYPFSIRKIRKLLNTILPAKHDRRLRLTLSDDGSINYKVQGITPADAPLKLAISKNPLTPAVQDARHKVSARVFYDGERARLNGLYGADEVLFLNERGELCEGSFTSLFIKQADCHYSTPNLSCGLLPGILREVMITHGQASEHILTLVDLQNADIFVGNSLRGLLPAKLLSLTPQ